MSAACEQQASKRGKPGPIRGTRIARKFVVFRCWSSMRDPQGRLDKLGVTGSSPVPPISIKALLRWGFLVSDRFAIHRPVYRVARKWQDWTELGRATMGTSRQGGCSGASRRVDIAAITVAGSGRGREGDVGRTFDTFPKERGMCDTRPTFQALPTALDNGHRSPRKLLASVVRRLVLALRRTYPLAATLSTSVPASTTAASGPRPRDRRRRPTVLRERRGRPTESARRR